MNPPGQAASFLLRWLEFPQRLLQDQPLASFPDLGGSHLQLGFLNWLALLARTRENKLGPDPLWSDHVKQTGQIHFSSGSALALYPTQSLSKPPRTAQQIPPLANAPQKQWNESSSPQLSAPLLSTVALWQLDCLWRREKSLIKFTAHPSTETCVHTRAGLGLPILVE